MESESRPSIEIHRVASTSARPSEYTWSVKLYAGSDWSRAELDETCDIISGIDAKLRELFGPHEVVKALTEAFDQGRKSERLQLLDLLKDDSLTLDGLEEQVRALTPL